MLSSTADTSFLRRPVLLLRTKPFPALNQYYIFPFAVLSAVLIVFCDVLQVLSGVITGYTEYHGPAFFRSTDVLSKRQS